MSEKERYEILRDAIAERPTRVDELAREVLKDHRTHQQTIVRFCIAVIQQMAQPTAYDLRNEAAVLVSKKIARYLEEEEASGGNDTYLPYI